MTSVRPRSPLRRLRGRASGRRARRANLGQPQPMVPLTWPVTGLGVPGVIWSSDTPRATRENIARDQIRFRWRS